MRYKPGENLVFSHCTWKNNTAVYSPTIDLSPYFHRDSDKSGFLPIPKFSHVKIIENQIKNEDRYKLKSTYRVNSGVFSISLSTVLFSEKVEFVNNSYTAMLLSSAIAVFGSNTSTLFANNYGGNGGAIAMYGFSTITVRVNSYFEFNGNCASEYGGGIFYRTIDQHDFITRSSCFLKYEGLNISASDRNITFIFRRNSAASGGSSIYADSFMGCFNFCDAKNESMEENFIHCIGNITIDEDEDSQTISKLESSGTVFEFHDGIEDYALIPGATRKVNFTVKDEFNQTVTPLMNVGISTATRNTSIQLSPSYTFHNDISARGHPNETATFHFLTHSIGGVYFRFNVTMLDCPPVFYFDPDTLTCKCSTEYNTDTKLYHAITYCDYTSFRAHMIKNYWAGYINVTAKSYENDVAAKSYENLFFSPCFEPLCRNSIHLPNSSAELESNVCFENRTGIMCGTCIEGHSAYIHSREFVCRPDHWCYLGPLFYLLSEILPVCILFAIIVLFDFSFTAGHTVGFIFFAQYLDRLTVHIDDIIPYYRKTYRVFYGIFNFEFFVIKPFSFCLWKDFQILDVMVFKYITILAALALVVALISLLKSNKCGWLLKWRTRITTKTSFVHGLSAFLVICYSQCTKTSFLILKSATPTGVNGTTVHRYSYYGGLPYLEGRHLIYAIVAIISLIFVTILPPLILLLHPLSLHLLSLCGRSEHWIVNKILKLTAINRLMPFLDCFQSCYKDRLRFFAGLYFVYRVVIQCTYNGFETYYGYRVSSDIALILFLGIHSVVQPYKNRIHNLIDSLVFLNLALILAISIFTVFIMEDIEDKNYDSNPFLMVLTVIQLVLLYLPMIVAVLYAVVKVYLYCRGRTSRRDYEMLEEIERE